ncbi:MAG: AAA family ATPase [Cyanobacteria bacterium P01_E01_bin.42]
MVSLAGYENFIQIHDSSNSQVYRARRIEDGQLIILKFLNQDYPSSEQIRRYKQEYYLTCQLEAPGIIKAYRLEEWQRSYAIALEDFGGISLKQWLQERKKLSLEEFLEIAIAITESLGQIHAHNIIHKDINPANIVFNPETKELKIIDFGISTQLSRESPTLKNPHVLEGTLAYISPEQTGRMNRELDYRSDFYSLGVTFYELLVNRLPFVTREPMELVHSHIAKQPESPHEKKIEIPRVISNIVMKLMAKTAEERYQSAWGLKADLETCFQELQRGDRISEFILGSRDLSDRFQIPQKLYGRQEQVEQLLASFERVSEGAAEMMLVAGYSGIGKSVVVNEIYKPITRQKGYFISGKFDQFKRDIPYTALIQAFQELLRQLLTESERQLQCWQQKLLEALGKNARVIIDVIPEVELIIGEQPSVPQLTPTQSQNRFNFVLQNFIGVFARKEHPLAIFIDDLQWADLASLKLLELLMSDRDRQYLFLIGAYRDNEVSTTHPLIQTLERIREQEANVEAIALKPLEINWVNQLIADTLKCSIEESHPLAELAFDKTHGNPFFLTQLLQSLYKERLLSFTSNSGRWQWDIEQIQTVGITDNVVELMVGKIEKLAEETQNPLKIAACIGNQFDLEILSFVNGTSMSDTAIALQPALEQGLILPLNDAYKLLILPNDEIPRASETSPVSIPYKFSHDRVQQAAYALIPDAQKQQVHLQIGQLLLQNTAPDEWEENIFDLVNQLNIGADLIAAVSQRNQLARLNLIAGKKAKESTAYQAAARYLNTGLQLLASDSWQREYELTLALHVEAIGAEYLNAEFARAEQLAAVVLERSRTTLDRVEVYEIQSQSYRSQGQFQRAIDITLEILAQLGIVLPPQPDREDIEAEEKAVELLLQDKRIDDLANLPEMKDPRQLAVVRMLLSIIVVSLLINYSLHLMIVFSLVKLFIQYGNSSLSAGGYIFYGQYLSGRKGDTNAGYEFGKLSLSLLDKFESWQLKVMCRHIFDGFIKHWKDDARETIDSVREDINQGIENGDLEYSGYSIARYNMHMLLTGENLKKIGIESEKFIKTIRKIKQTSAFIHTGITRQVVLNLSKISDYQLKLIGDNFNEEKNLPILIQAKNMIGLFWFYTAKTMLMYLFKNYEGAIENANSAAQYLSPSAGMIVTVVYNFYDSLASLAIADRQQLTERRQILKKVSSNQKRLKKWADGAPINYRHKYDLVAAEQARVLGRNALARDYYDRAIEGAKKHGFIHEEAIAYERGAEFYFAIGREEIGWLYIKNAHYAYQRWGAVAKVQDLEVEYPELLRPTTSPTGKVTITSSSDSSDGEELDLATVIKSTNALSSEIVLEKLLATLMNILVENAGAERGILILPRSENLLVEATKETDSENVSILQSLPIEEFARLSTKIVRYVARTRETVVLNHAINKGNFTDDAYIQQYQCQSIACTPLINQSKLQGIIYLENNLTTGAFSEGRMELLRTLATQAAISLENARLYDACVRFVPGQFLSLLEKESIVDVKLGDRVEREMTVLFSDIRDFTTISEQMTPEENFAFINGYLGRMEPLIQQYGGFIDKYIGDAIMALFGNSPDDALQAAIAMLEALKTYNDDRQANNRPPIRIGIGLHTGRLMLGTVGGADRMDGTAIGDSVNLSSRVEGLTKTYGIPLLITHQTFLSLKNPFEYDFRFIERVMAKGKAKAVSLFEIFSADSPDLRERKNATKGTFEAGVMLFHQQAFREAARCFAECLEYCQGDRAARSYWERCQQYIS